MTEPVYGLYKVDGTLITPYITLIPAKRIIKVVNQTLNGQYHVQTIGLPSEILNVEVQCDSSTRELIDDISIRMEIVQIKYGINTYLGVIIDEELKWSKITKRSNYYQTTFQLSVVT